MDNIAIGKILTSLWDLIDNTSPFDWLMFISIVVESSPFAILSKEIAVVVSVVDINKLDDVGVM